MYSGIVGQGRRQIQKLNGVEVGHAVSVENGLSEVDALVRRYNFD